MDVKIETIASITAVVFSLGTIFYHGVIVKRDVEHLTYETKKYGIDIKQYGVDIKSISEKASNNKHKIDSLSAKLDYYNDFNKYKFDEADKAIEEADKAIEEAIEERMKLLSRDSGQISNTLHKVLNKLEENED